MGLAKLSFTEFDEPSNEYERVIFGVVSHYNPFGNFNNEYINPIFVGLRVAKISEYSIRDWGIGGSLWDDYPGIYDRRTKQDYLLNISLGYKFNFEKINFLLELGWHHREYNLSYQKNYYDENMYLIREHIKIPKIENTVFIETGLQFVF